MKKTVLCLLIFILCVQPCFALNAQGYPASDGSIAANQLGATIDNTSVLLSFDPSLDYSFVYDKTVQACFFAYNEQNTSYIELYLMLPDSVAAGDIIDPAYCQQHECSLCGVSFSEVLDISSTYYTVFSSNGAGYPAGADFRIEITSASANNGEVTIEGTFSAVLCRFDGLNQTNEMMTIDNASFSCTVSPRADAPAPRTSPDAPSLPETTIMPVLPSPTPFGVKV